MSVMITHDFLAARFPDLAGGETIEVRPLGAERTTGPRIWFTAPSAAADYALGLPPHWAVYYGVLPRVRGGGKKRHVTRVTTLWADLDDKRFSSGRVGTLAALAGFPFAPTWLIDSGGGLQPYWALREPLPVANDPAAVARVEGLLRRLYARLGGLDAVQDLSRILRVPGTYNRKPEYGTPRLVTVLDHQPGNRYALADFEALLPSPASPPARSSAAFSRTRDRADVPSPAEVAEMLRHIPPRGDYTDDWLRVLAAVHSIYPGPEGVALCEAWSPGTPDEVARKFASFGQYQGERGPATIGTLIWLARRHGWRPALRFRLREVRHA